MENYTDNQQPDQQEERPAPTQNNRLNKRAIVLTIALFVLIIAGMFVFAYMQQDQNDAGAVTDEEQNSDVDERYASITRIDAKHFYEDGVHTLVGEVAMPTPCDLLEASTRVAESMPEQVTVEFSVVNNAEFCAQTITPQRFKVSATASEEAVIRAYFEGRDIPLNLIDPEPGETPEEFELFLKG